MANRITPAHIRGARGMLDWSMAQLAQASELSISTIKRMEMPIQQPISDQAYDMVRRAFEEAGMLFFDDDDGYGMRLQSR